LGKGVNETTADSGRGPKNQREERVEQRAQHRHGAAVSHILIEPGGERHFLVSSPLNGELGYEHIDEAK
jgi:hypothetical protein